MTQVYTATEAAAALGIPAALIRKWKHRGVVFPVDTMRGTGPSATSPLYNLEDLQPLAKRYLESTARHAGVGR